MQLQVSPNRRRAAPNEDYFRYVDEMIEQANSLGMFVGLLPTRAAYPFVQRYFVKGITFGGIKE